MATMATKFDIAKLDGMGLGDAPSTDVLKKAFDTALLQLRGHSPAHRPIVCREKPVVGASTFDQRALSNAAQALAQLWNVPSRGGRR